MLKYPNSDVVALTSALQELRLAATRLSLMKDRNPVAKKGEPILHHCCQLLEARTCAPLSAPIDQDLDGGVLSDDLAGFLKDLSSSAPDEPTRGLLTTMANAVAPDGIDIDPIDQACGSLGQTGTDMASFLDDGGVNRELANMHPGREP
ncbi:hypothetical protein LTR37_006246 [Vermiconidia calcicola]|uniref:Uncharacterized protein n=1 Tax=Vermiconidia calcicola TaxID=1690605 RepID=A0ACC3NGF6_9PEZI|nr:hypothetical protein LTR37_006246 [Vermiconidia calcicola]